MVISNSTCSYQFWCPLLIFSHGTVRKDQMKGVGSQERNLLKHGDIKFYLCIPVLMSFAYFQSHSTVRINERCGVTHSKEAVLWLHLYYDSWKYGCENIHYVEAGIFSEMPTWKLCFYGFPWSAPPELQGDVQWRSTNCNLREITDAFPVLAKAMFSWMQFSFNS